MAPPLHSKDTWSYNGGRNILTEKKLLEELPAIADAYIEHGGGNQNLAGRREHLDPLQWEQEVSIKFETNAGGEEISRRGSFDAYKEGVIVEHERGEQMRANWHLMKMAIAHRDPTVFPEHRIAEAGVLLIPDYVSFPTRERTEADVQAVLDQYFEFELPFFVWEYPTE